MLHQWNVQWLPFIVRSGVFMLLYRIVCIVFPIFAVVLVGFCYGYRYRPDMAVLNRLNMDLFFPALIFVALAGRGFNLTDNLLLVVGCIMVCLGSGLLTWPLARMLKVDAKTLVPPTMFRNVGNMGLPLLLLTFGETALGAAVVILLVVNVLQFALAPWLLRGHFSLLAIWRQPFILAAVAGVTVSLGGISLWPPLLSAARLLGDISLGLMIFSLGVRLSSARIGEMLGIGMAGAIVTPLSGMLLAWLFGALIPLGTREMDILFLSGALPPAVTNYIFADRYQQETDKVAAIVMIGNVSALLFIPLALALRL